MKTFEQFNKEVDPYGEEDWDNKTNFLAKAINRNNMIIYVATFVKDENEAREQMKKDIGVTNEYGPLDFEETTSANVRRISEELTKLSEEISSLRDGNWKINN